MLFTKDNSQKSWHQDLGGNKKKTYLPITAYQLELRDIGETMPLKLIDLDSFPVVSVNCDNQKVIGKGKCTQQGLKNEKPYNIEFRKKAMAKWKTNLESIKNQNISSC